MGLLQSLTTWLTGNTAKMDSLTKAIEIIQAQLKDTSSGTTSNAYPFGLGGYTDTWLAKVVSQTGNLLTVKTITGDPAIPPADVDPADRAGIYVGEGIKYKADDIVLVAQTGIASSSKPRTFCAVGLPGRYGFLAVVTVAPANGLCTVQRLSGDDATGTTGDGTDITDVVMRSI